MKLRARYRDGDYLERPWSGPWTAAVVRRVKDHPPSAPAGLRVSQVAHDRVTLSWDDPDDDRISGYQVLRGDDASLSVIVADTGGSGTTYVDDTVSAETAYTYAVKALSRDGASPSSATVSATTPPPRCSSRRGRARATSRRRRWWSRIRTRRRRRRPRGSPRRRLPTA